MKREHSILEILIKPALIIFSVIGVALQVKVDGGFFATNVYLYFTILSNTLIAATFFAFLVMEIIERIIGKNIIPQWLFTVKYMITSAMFLTLLVSAALLMPFKNQAYLFSLKNLCQHIFASFIALLDFIMFDRNFKCTVKAFALSFVFPLLYLAVTLALSLKPITYSNGSNFPYYFLDYRTNGWLTVPPNGLGVLWWILIIAAMLALSTAVLFGIKALQNRIITQNNPSG